MPSPYDVKVESDKAVGPGPVLDPMLGKTVAIVVGPPPCLGDDVNLAWAKGTLLLTAGVYSIAGTGVIIRFTAEMVTRIEHGTEQYPVIMVSV